jgi:hypothetical protein
MLAYYLEWHMRQSLAPMLFEDTDKHAAEALRASVVAPAQRSPAAVLKQTTKLSPDGLPVHSFQTLLADLATRSHAKSSADRRHQADRHAIQGLAAARRHFVASRAALPPPFRKRFQLFAPSQSGKLGLAV